MICCIGGFHPAQRWIRIVLWQVRLAYWMAAMFRLREGFWRAHMSIRMLICDDHQVIRTGSGQPVGRHRHRDCRRGGQRQGSPAAGPEAQAGHRLARHPHARRRRPGDAGEAPRKVPESKVVMLSTYDNPDLHRPGRGPGRQRLRAEGLVARRHRGDDRGGRRRASRPAAPAS